MKHKQTFNRSESGKGLIEYALIVLIITLVTVTATAVGSHSIGDALTRAFIKVASVLGGGQ